MSLVVPYIPVVAINRKPDGTTSTVNQDYNRIGSGFINHFAGDGTSTSYFLTLDNLDDTPVTITISGSVKVEDTDFSVDRISGVIDFTGGSDPFGSPTSGENNVAITAYKTNQENIDSINHCKYSIVYGSGNELRVFVCGNGTNHVYWSDSLNPEYFPENNYIGLGGDNIECTGFGKQYDLLIVFKTHSIYSISYVLSGQTVLFPSKLINNKIGCDMPYTIELIDNRLVWCNTYNGVNILTSTVLEDEKNIRQISSNINGSTSTSGIFSELKEDMVLASSVNYEALSQYWVCIKFNVYMWDYGTSPYLDSGNPDDDQRRLSWWFFNNITSNCFYQNNRDLYYGDRESGQLVHFTNKLSDYGQAVIAKYRLSNINFGIINWLKTIKEITFELVGGVDSRVDIKYITDRGERSEDNPIVESGDIGQSITKHPNNKHINYWSMELSNDYIESDLGIINFVARWILSRKIR